MGTIRTRSRCARPHFGQGRPVSSPPSRPEEREGIRGMHDSYAHEQNALGALSPPGRRGMRERAVTGPCPTAGTETPSRSGETAPADRPAGTCQRLAGEEGRPMQEFSIGELFWIFYILS